MPKKKVKAVLHSLSLRLLLRLYIILCTVIAVYAFINYKSTRELWTEVTEANAERTSALVKGATHYGMLLNRKEAVQHTISQLGTHEGVSEIRVFDKNGRIAFSDDLSEVGTRVDEKAEACVYCHISDVPSAVNEHHDGWTREFENADGEKTLGLISPIRNEAKCSTAACHAHPSDQTVLGVLDVQMSLASVDEALRTTSQQGMWTTLVILLALGIGTAVFVVKMVQRPVRKLHLGTQRIANGELHTRIEIDSADELGHLAGAFNRMAEDLEHAHEELTRWSRQLEKKVQDKTKELGNVQKQVIHMEKMASLGKLSATVAHELNNPLAGMLTYAKLVERELKDQALPEESRKELFRYLELIQKESSRCGTIVRDLLLFARQSRPELTQAHAREIIDRSLLLINHHMEMNNVQVVREFSEKSDQFTCDANQLQQALVAILVNAVESMTGTGGVLSIRLKDSDDDIFIDVKDTGAGVNPEMLPHIFEPFFSTKEDEKGVGLGLSIVYGIIQHHGGTIDVESEINKGTIFHLRLPRNSPVRQRDEASLES